MSALTIPLLAVLAVAATGDGAPAAVDTAAYAAWRPLLAAELELQAVDCPRDLYKFLHQGVMGPAHAVDDPAQAREWLAREWDGLDDLAATDRPPLLYPLRPDGRLVRLDLVRLRDRVGADGSAALDSVAAAFARTAESWSREPELLARLWAAAAADSALWRGHFTAAELDSFARDLGGAWPAVHHSDSYRRRHAPHYRLVEPRLLPEAWRREEVRP